MTSSVLLKEIFSRFRLSRNLTFDFPIWRLIQGGCPCLGTDKSRTSNTYRALVPHQRKPSIHFYVTAEAKLCNVFIHHRAEGWCDGEVKRNQDHTDLRQALRLLGWSLSGPRGPHK